MRTRSDEVAGPSSTPASLVPKRVIKEAVAAFTQAHDRAWRHAVRKALRDEHERNWELPLGVRVREHVGPRGVRWMIAHDDPYVAEWLAERMEKRLHAGAQDADFVLRLFADEPQQDGDAGLTVVAVVWVSAPDNSQKARWQMGRILLAVLDGIQRSPCDSCGRLSVPDEASLA
ncbi:MAG TPA: hypothetical protein VN259_09840 [Xanthomonadales bacterium]|nr:hypothetical protein [Xanthomonadales bacterium]